MKRKTSFKCVSLSVFETWNPFQKKKERKIRIIFVPKLYSVYLLKAAYIQVPFVTYKYLFYVKSKVLTTTLETCSDKARKLELIQLKMVFHV